MEEVRQKYHNIKSEPLLTSCAKIAERATTIEEFNQLEKELISCGMQIFSDVAKSPKNAGDSIKTVCDAKFSISEIRNACYLSAQ
jgi:hypothetical protein